MFTETYAKEKAAALVRDHNAYRKMRQEAACRDYRIALDNLIHVAGRKGWIIEYRVSKAGYLTLL
ncbi:MAG: hypothetical protein IJ766_05025 [Clostridia bacterium]|nr:hypothetical protein [Clostridia bacterium]